jgi:hypothetical protein
VGRHRRELDGPPILIRTRRKEGTRARNGSAVWPARHVWRCPLLRCGVPRCNVLQRAVPLVTPVTGHRRACGACGAWAAVGCRRRRWSGGWRYTAVRPGPRYEPRSTRMYRGVHLCTHNDTRVHARTHMRTRARTGALTSMHAQVPGAEAAVGEDRPAPGREGGVPPNTSQPHTPARTVGRSIAHSLAQSRTRLAGCRSG